MAPTTIMSNLSGESQCCASCVERQLHKSHSSRLRRLILPTSFALLILLTGLFALRCLRDGHFSAGELDELLPRDLGGVAPIVVFVILGAGLFFVFTIIIARSRQKKEEPKEEEKKKPEDPATAQRVYYTYPSGAYPSGPYSSGMPAPPMPVYIYQKS